MNPLALRIGVHVVVNCNGVIDVPSGRLCRVGLSAGETPWVQCVIQDPLTEQEVAMDCPGKDKSAAGGPGGRDVAVHGPKGNVLVAARSSVALDEFKQWNGFEEAMKDEHIRAKMEAGEPMIQVWVDCTVGGLEIWIGDTGICLDSAPVDITERLFNARGGGVLLCTEGIVVA